MRSTIHNHQDSQPDEILCNIKVKSELLMTLKKGHLFVNIIPHEIWLYEPPPFILTNTGTYV